MLRPDLVCFIVVSSYSLSNGPNFAILLCAMVGPSKIGDFGYLQTLNWLDFDVLNCLWSLWINLGKGSLHNDVNFWCMQGH